MQSLRPPGQRHRLHRLPRSRAGLHTGLAGAREFSPLWHVFLIVPAYTGDPAHDAAVNAAYAAQLPTRSEDAVDALLDTRLGDGSPVAAEIDLHFYFLCSVVSANAAK